MQTPHTITADDLVRIDSDMYGNPRYAIHFLALGLDRYAHTKRTKRAGLSMYRGKQFGGMFTLTSYGDREQIAHTLNQDMFGECRHVFRVRHDARERTCRYCGETFKN